MERPNSTPCLFTVLLTLKTNTFGEHCGNGQLLQNRALTKAVRALPRPARPPWEHGRGSHPGANMSQVSTKEDATDVAVTPRCIYTREQIQTCAASRGGSMNESTPQRCVFVSGGGGDSGHLWQKVRYARTKEASPDLNCTKYHIRIPKRIQPRKSGADYARSIWYLPPANPDICLPRRRLN